MEREMMEFDVVIVGAGPSGLAAAIRLQQLATEAGQELMICLVEKGSEIGAHVLSGAVFEPRALDELLPDWQAQGAPVRTKVQSDQFHFLASANKSVSIPGFLVPSPMHNQGNYVISLGQLCRWLGEQAEAMEVNIFPGFAATEVIYDDQGRVNGVITGDMGVGQSGEHKENYQPGYELRARYTLFAEGCRGSLGQHLEKNSNCALLPIHSIMVLV